MPTRTDQPCIESRFSVVPGKFGGFLLYFGNAAHTHTMYNMRFMSQEEAQRWASMLNLAIESAEAILKEV